MTTASPIAKVSVGRSGCGAAHASYITRMSALDPEGRDRAARNAEVRFEQLSLLTYDQTEKTEPSVTETLRDNLDHRSMDAEQEHAGGGERDADPVWTWNAPDFLTGDTNGKRPELGQSNDSEELSLKEKTENLRLYFGSLEDYERRKGGRTHYRIILSFDVPATNQQMRDLTNNFLEQAFPKAIAFGAIHRDTDHPHVHLYLNSRQTDGRRIQLKNNEFKTIDEKWSKIYTNFAGDKSAHVEYLRKKEETKQWKITAAEAFRKGKPIPPKPERDNDRRERLAEQRLSAQRSEARDQGKRLESRPPAEPVIRAGSEKETGRLLAKVQVAQEQLAHLIRTEAHQGEIRSIANNAYDLKATVDKTIAARKQDGKEWLPAVVYTTEECKQLKEYMASHLIPVKKEHAAARIQAARVVAGAELSDAEGKAEAFRTTRHFWKFEVEGWDRKLSLKEVEQEIKNKTEEKFKLYNFLRPSKRESIQGQIDYLSDVKRDVQKQLLVRDAAVSRTLGAAGLKYEVSSKQAEQAQQARSREGKAMPLPVFQKDELRKMAEIATRNKDARLLALVYSQVREILLREPTDQALSRVKGHAVMARMEMLREAERLKAAIQYGEFRQVPLRDANGLDYTKSLREVEPRSVLEAVIRHFTDSEKQKRERQEIGDIGREQLRRAEAQSIKARDYSVVLDNIAADHFRAAGVQPGQIAPELDAKQIAALREFAEKQPLLSGARRDFAEAARQAERELQERDVAEAARESERGITHDPSTRSREQFPSEATTIANRTDRDSYARGR
jgi:MobA/VirD2-like, nuclease domain